MTISRSLAGDFDLKVTQSHVPAETRFLEALEMCCHAGEPEVGRIGWGCDGVAVVVGCEGGAVVSDESGCYLFGCDVGVLGEGDGGAVGFHEGCGCFEGGHLVAGISWVQ